MTYDAVNIKVFNDLQHTITGWPGGKPNADDSTRPVKSTPFPKNVIIFSGGGTYESAGRTFQIQKDHCQASGRQAEVPL